jgi:hypothetical protein
MKFCILFALGSAIPNEDACCEKNIDIDGSLFRRNVVDDLPDVESASLCKSACRQNRPDCQYYIYERVTKNCVLYKGISNIEYDDDSDEGKCIGHVDKCQATECKRPGWDYVKTGSGQNIVQYRAVFDVPDIFTCLKICRLTPDCHHVSYKTTKTRCHLKNSNALDGREEDFNYKSAARCCDKEACVYRGVEYENTWKTSYDIIKYSATASIPNVAQPEDCDKICQLIPSCQFWTYELPEKNCYLVRSNTGLEYSEDKVSGSRKCTENLPNNFMEKSSDPQCPNIDDFTSSSSESFSSSFSDSFSGAH